MSPLCTVLPCRISLSEFLSISKIDTQHIKLIINRKIQRIISGSLVIISVLCVLVAFLILGRLLLIIVVRHIDLVCLSESLCRTVPFLSGNCRRLSLILIA